MPRRLDSPEEVERARNILTAALGAQLNLLRGFFPVAGWLLLQRRDGEVNILAAQGAWNPEANADALGQLMQGGWAKHKGLPGFQYRSLDSAEVVDAATPLWTDADAPGRLLRFPLRDLEGDVMAWLLGLATKACRPIASGGQSATELVKQALDALALLLSQHAHFEQTFQQLVEAKRSAFIEPLTLVLNRAGWMERVRHIENVVERSGEDVAIIVLDLDLLKLVNDTDGHSAGDELLQLTAQTVTSVVRSDDAVGRLGGDEFGVAVRGVSPAQANELVKRLRAALDEVGVNVSIGMALKSEAGTLNDTFIRADERMYEEKRARPVPERAMRWRRGLVRQSRELPDVCL